MLISSAAFLTNFSSGFFLSVIGVGTEIIKTSAGSMCDEKLIFANDFLKSFHSALYEWSGNEFFKTKKVFKPIPDIKYHDNIWIIF